MTTPINGHQAPADVDAFSVNPAEAAQRLAELDNATGSALPASDGTVDQDAGSVAELGGEGGRGPSQATMLRRLALGRFRFGCAPDGTPFAVPIGGPRVARSLRGGKTSLRAELAKLYARAYGGNVPSASALADALTALEGEAGETDPEPLALRVAEYDGSLLLDLGRADGRVVQVTPGGWSVLGTSPVLFRRTALTGPLPDPARPGDLTPLRERLNVSDADWSLVLAWLCAALTPSPPHPLLALLGEQGTGKSTATRLVVEVIDPSPVPLRPAPRDEDQWSVAAASSWVVGLDNLSGVAPWFSDSLCRAVTGAGSIRRRLYTDDDVSVLAFRRAVVVNGIDFGDLRGDLADRMLAVELHVIGDDQRRTDADIAMRADEHAAVLGGLLGSRRGGAGRVPRGASWSGCRAWPTSPASSPPSTRYAAPSRSAGTCPSAGSSPRPSSRVTSSPPKSGTSPTPTSTGPAPAANYSPRSPRASSAGPSRGPPPNAPPAPPCPASPPRCGNSATPSPATANRAPGAGYGPCLPRAARSRQRRAGKHRHDRHNRHGRPLTSQNSVTVGKT